MTRDITPGMADASDDAVVRPHLFVHLDVRNDPVWAWTGLADATLTVASDPLLSGGQAFSAAGLVEMGALLQDASGQVRRMSIRKAAADFSVQPFAKFLATPTDWRLRGAAVWYGLAADNGLSIADPFRLFTGRIERILASDGKVSHIRVDLVDKAVDGRRRNGWRYTGPHQRKIHPGDKAFDHVQDLANQELVIGGPADPRPTTPGRRFPPSSGLGGRLRRRP